MISDYAICVETKSNLGIVRNGPQVRSSSFCLNVSIQEHTKLLEFDLKFTELVERSFFPDDFIEGENSLAESVNYLKS